MLTDDVRAAIAREFPHYPVDSLPGDIPEFMIACPWHNDACPIWGDQGACGQAGAVNLAIAEPDEADRELPGLRFQIWIDDEEGYGTMLPGSLYPTELLGRGEDAPLHTVRGSLSGESAAVSAAAYPARSRASCPQRVMPWGLWGARANGRPNGKGDQMAKLYQVYKQPAGACNPLGESLDPGWYWIRERASYVAGLPPVPYGIETGPFATKREADKAARATLRGEG